MATYARREIVIEIKKPNQASDYVQLKLFSPRGSLTLISINGESHINTYQDGRSGPRKK